SPALDHFADPPRDLSVCLSPFFRQAHPDVAVGAIIKRDEAVLPHPIEVAHEDVVVHVRSDLKVRPKHRTVRLPESVEDPREDVEVGALHLGHSSPREDSPQLRLDRRPALFPAPPVPVVLTLDLADPMPSDRNSHPLRAPESSGNAAGTRATSPKRPSGRRRKKRGSLGTAGDWAGETERPARSLGIRRPRR